MTEFRMPSLGADMEAATLVEWLVKPGDRVKRGDVVAVVETQKGAIEVEIFEDGVVEEFLVDIDAKVPVGTALARIASDAGVAGAPTPAVAVRPPAARIPPPAGEPARAQPARAALSRPIGGTIAEAGRVRASPAARRLAEQCAIELSSVRATGPAGAVVRADVERAMGVAGAVAAKPRAEKARPLGLDLSAMRSAIAAAMARSKREIPHYYLAQDVDLARCQEWLAMTNAQRPPEDRLLMGALAIKAVALACKRYPMFNGFHRDGSFEASPNVHVGFAIAIRGGGLAAPGIHDADQLPLDALMTRLRDLVQRTRAGRIRSSEMADPTITVSSLGERGVDTLYGVIYPPQVAIVGLGKVSDRPWVVDGTVGARPVATLTLSADHRVSDGHAGALFLAEIGKLLQEPEKL